MDEKHLDHQLISFSQLSIYYIHYARKWTMIKTFNLIYFFINKRLNITDAYDSYKFLAHTRPQVDELVKFNTPSILSLAFCIRHTYIWKQVNQT